MSKATPALQPPPAWLCRSTDDELAEFAQRKAHGSTRRISASATPLLAYRRMRAEAAEIGIAAPKVGKGTHCKTLAGALARLKDAQWWARPLRAIVSRELEREARDAGRVHRRAGIYVSDAGLSRRRRRRLTLRRMMAHMVATNELGDSLAMDAVQAASVANPINRRCELMARISGLDRIAFDLGHAAAFYTVTCPARMHCRDSRSGEPIPKYDGTTPKEANDYLAALWKRIRAKLHRLGIRVYGVRVVEPHHDGTPHWHFLLFMPREHADTVRSVLKAYALAEDSDERGAARHRFKCEPIDHSKGTAVGYIAKYISKNIDGHGLDNDTYGTAAEEAATRIEAWASTWGIRQFAQIGGAPVSIWRECRRAGQAPAGVLGETCRAADEADFARFLEGLGGPQTPRKELPVQVAKAWSDEPGRYGEPKGYAPFGLTAGETTVVTRLHEWRIARRDEAEAEAGNGERHAAAMPAVAPDLQAAVIRKRWAAKPPLEFEFGVRVRVRVRVLSITVRTSTAEPIQVLSRLHSR